MAVNDRTDVVTVFAVGDVVCNREEPETLFANVAPTLGEGDIVVGQLEGVITDKAGYKDSAGWGPHPADPQNVRGFTTGGFNLLTWASNNCLDFGPDAFLDTIEHLRGTGIQVTGGGKNIEEARRPAIFDMKGTRVGFLAYNTR